MPPKKKQSSSKASKAAKGKGTSKIPPSSKKSKEDAGAQQRPPTKYDKLPRHELESIVQQLEAKSNEIQTNADYARTEHDAVLSYYEVTKRQVQDVDLQISDLDRQTEQAEEDHALELGVYDDRITRLRYDHAHRLQTAREDSLVRQQAAEEDHVSHTLRDLSDARDGIVRQIEELQMLQTEEVYDMKRRHAEELEAEGQRLEMELVTFRNRCEEHHTEMIRDIELQRCANARTAQERGNARIRELERQHQEMMEETEAYYGGIIQDNNVTIQSLGDEIIAIQDSAKRSRDKIDELSDENNQLSGPLAIAVDKMQTLTLATKDFEKEGERLKNTKARIALTRRRINALKDDYQALQTKCSSVEQERDELRAQMEVDAEQRMKI